MEEMDFEKLNGLIPVVIQDWESLQVLMLGFMNRQAYEQTRREGYVTFYSRSKQQLWTKGETSGNYLEVKEMVLDCDQDSLLIKATPYGNVCHTGRYSCFHQPAPNVPPEGSSQPDHPKRSESSYSNDGDDPIDGPKNFRGPRNFGGGKFFGGPNSFGTANSFDNENPFDRQNFFNGENSFDDPNSLASPNSLDNRKHADPPDPASFPSLDFLGQLEELLRDRKVHMPEGSYTAKLFGKGINKIAQKVGEEAVELVIEAKDDNRNLFLNEGADLMYHLLVLMVQKGYSLADVVEVLKGRHG